MINEAYKKSNLTYVYVEVTIFSSKLHIFVWMLNYILRFLYFEEWQFNYGLITAF